MFQCNRVPQYIRKVELAPVKGGHRSSGGDGKVWGEGFHLKVSVNSVACLDTVIFSVG